MTQEQLNTDQKPQEMPVGQKFLQAFNLLINSVRMHQDNNQTVVHSVEEFLGIIRQFLQDAEDVTLMFTEGGFYLQEEKIVCEKRAAPFTKAIHKFFEERNLEGLRFDDSVMDAPVAEITGFARLLSQASLHEDPLDWLEKEIDKQKFFWVEMISVAPISLDVQKKTPASPTGTVKEKKPAKPSAPADPRRTRGVSEETRMKKKKNALQTYGYAVLSLKDIARKIGSNKKASIKKTMRLVQNMIDMVVDDNQIFLSLSTIRDHDDYTFIHSINVAILSVSLGHKIGMPKSSLETLSLSALFHDLGKIDIPHEILNKPNRLTEPEFQIIKQHSLDSVRRIIKLRTSRKKKISILLPPFEHHLKYDLSGYPKTPRKKPVSLLGRIITIADVFDAITAPRIYRPTSISPDRALGYMLEKSGKDFDPVLLKVFINMIGVYPVGTLLKFEDEGLGLVARYSEDDKTCRELWVQMITPVSDGGFEKGELVSLGCLDPKTSTFDRQIVESIHPADLGIQPAEFIM